MILRSDSSTSVESKEREGGSEVVSPSVEQAAVGPRRVVVPPQPYDRLKMFVGLLVALVVCGPLYFMELGKGEVVLEEEGSALLTSRETWLRQHKGVTKAWRLPTTMGEPEVVRGPMTTWLHLLAWVDLDPETAEDATLAKRARWISALMMMLGLASTFWAGMSIGGRTVAVMATLALGTTLLLVHQGRLASSDAPMFGLTALSIASGLWAMRPLKESNWTSRRVSGWLVCACALAGAILTRGPVAFIFVLPPLVAVIVLTPQRWLGNLIGLLFAAALSLIFVAPWYLYVMNELKGGWGRLSEQAVAPNELFVLSLSHRRLIALLSPWQIWLVAALFQPFLRAENQRHRRQLLIAWVWFVLIIVAFSIPAANEPRYLVPMLPAMGLLVGQMWAFHIRLASQRVDDPGVNFLRVPHWMLLGFASIVGPAFIALQPWMIEHGYLERVEVAGIGWLWAWVIGVLLLLIVVLGARWHFKWHPRFAAYATVGWMFVAISAGFFGYIRSHHFRNEHIVTARTITAEVREEQLLFLGVKNDRTGKQIEPDKSFMFYLNRVVGRLEVGQLKDLPRKAGAGVWVITPDNEEAREALTKAGFVAKREFEDGEIRQRLYHRNGG